MVFFFHINMSNQRSCISLKVTHFSTPQLLLKSRMEITCALVCEILLAILLPPLGVCLRNGCCTVEFLICLVLTILGYVPGIIYALYAILCVEREPRVDHYDTLA